MKGTLKLLTAAVCAALPLIASEAQTLETEEVRVTASRVEKELMDVGMSVSVITAEDIRHSSARNVGELLANVPGVRIMNDGSQGMKRVQIRGEDAFRTVIMIDGQRISEHKSMSGAPILIDPAMIERIEVIKGPASVLYGSDAIGGAVNIITKKGAGDRFNAEVSGGLNSSSSGASASAAVYGAANGFEYRLSGAYEKADKLETPIGEVPNTEFDSRAANLYLAYNISPDTKLGFTADTYELDFKSGVQEGSYDDFFVDVPKWKRTKGTVFVESKNLTENLVRLRADAFYQESHKDMHNRVYMSPMKMDNYADNKLSQTGVSVQTDWQLGDDHYLIAGYEFLYDDLDADSHYQTAVNMVTPFMTINSQAIKRQAHEGNQQMHAVYAAMESQLPADLTLNYGVRYTWVKSEVTSQEGYNRTVNGQTPAFPELGDKSTLDQSDSRAVFNVGAVWRGIEHTALRAGWSQGFRAPNLMERYIPTSMGGGNVIPNPDLKPETSNNFEIGLRMTPGRAVLDAAVFYSDAKDYISSFEVQDNVYQNKNVAGAKTAGIELEASYRFACGFEPYVQATYLRRKFEQDGMSTHDTGTPELFGRYGVRWNDRFDGVNLRADAYAVSQSETRQYDFDSQETTGYAGSTTFNLTGGVSFGPQDAYSLDVGLYNITDKLYKTSSAIYEPGRYFTVKFSARY